MPEGDSIHRLAARLRPRLVGRRVLALEAHQIDDALLATVVGHSVLEVEARGKNLLVRFDDGRALHVHLRMLGRLSIERPRSTYWRPRRTSHQVRLVVEGAVVVGDRIPVVRLLKAGAEERAPDLVGLGPDLLAAELDEAECITRLKDLGVRPIGEALLVQRALAGIGNIYKSETLFLEGIAPTTPVTHIDDRGLARLVRRASILLKRNLGRGPRTTRNALSGSRFWVYGRADRPCYKCGATISRILQGAPPGRSTYHCPRCQTDPRDARANERQS